MDLREFIRTNTRNLAVKNFSALDFHKIFTGREFRIGKIVPPDRADNPETYLTLAAEYGVDVNGQRVKVFRINLECTCIERPNCFPFIFIDETFTPDEVGYDPPDQEYEY